MASSSERKSSPVECVHCGAPVAQRIGGIPICDNCYTIRGSCCHEFEEDAGFASPPCYAHLFDEEDPVDECELEDDNPNQNHRATNHS